MILAQISDTHILAADADDADEARACGRLQALERCVGDINSLDPLPHGVIHTGDMSQNGRPEEYAFAREALDRLRMPYYVTPGNRDERGAFAAAFGIAGDGTFVQYAIDDHPVRLVAVDSLSLNGNMGDLCDRRLVALAELLAAVPDKPTAIFLHHPPFDVMTASEERRFQYHRRQAVDDLADLLSRCPQVIHVFSGHAHRPWRAGIGHAQASTMPSVAWDLRMGDYPPALAETPVYQLHGYTPETGFVSQSRIAT